MDLLKRKIFWQALILITSQHQKSSNFATRIFPGHLQGKCSRIFSSPSRFVKKFFLSDFSLIKQILSGFFLCRTNLYQNIFLSNIFIENFILSNRSIQNFLINQICPEIYFVDEMYLKCFLVKLIAFFMSNQVLYHFYWLSKIIQDFFLANKFF